MINKENILKQIQIDYANELNEFMIYNFLLNESYFIDYKLKGLNSVIEGFEEVGEFYIGNDEFKYGEKSANRNLFGYYFLYREFLIDKNQKYKTLTRKKDKKLNANFIVGLKFATGEVYKYFELNKSGNYVAKDNLSFDTITEKLNLKLTLRPFISETINKNEKRGSKNIFKDKNVMLLLKNHCLQNEIIICQEFINELEKIVKE